MALEDKYQIGWFLLLAVLVIREWLTGRKKKVSAECVHNVKGMLRDKQRQPLLQNSELSKAATKACSKAGQEA